MLIRRGVQSKSVDDEDDKPISLSQSPIANWKAESSRFIPDERVWYTSYVVSGSLAIFMLYFCILREENDIDEMIYRPLPETLKGIEEIFPEVDFYSKPDFVLYHEEVKRRKAESSR